MVTKDGQQKTLIRRCEVVKLNYELWSSSSSVSNFKILERYGKSSVEIEFYYYSFSANNDDTSQSSSAVDFVVEVNEAREDCANDGSGVEVARRSEEKIINFRLFFLFDLARD